MLNLQDYVIINISGRYNQYLLVFLQRCSHQGKPAPKTTTVGCVWPSMFSNAQTYLDWLMVNLVGIEKI